MDPYMFLKIELNPDGSLTRSDPFPRLPATGDDAEEAKVLSRDLPLNPETKTWLRIYLPRDVEHNRRLPIILYFHGGGFVLFSAASFFHHNICEAVSAAVPAVVVSVEYRLAPEHRLPAAYDDAMDALRWLQGQAENAGETPGNGVEGADPWVAQRGDFSRCFLMGSSAGANIVYHMAIRSLSIHLGTLSIKGLILDQPYFGGTKRTESELQNAQTDPIIPLPANDLLWELSLPEDADRDHEYCNVPAAHRRRAAESALPLPRCLVRGHGGDSLVDRQKEMAKTLEECGVTVVARFRDGGFHAAEIADADLANGMIDDIRQFIDSADGSASVDAVAVPIRSDI